MSTLTHLSLHTHENGDIILRWDNPDSAAPPDRRYLFLRAEAGNDVNKALAQFAVEAAKVAVDVTS